MLSHNRVIFAHGHFFGHRPSVFLGDIKVSRSRCRVQADFDCGRLRHKSSPAPNSLAFGKIHCRALSSGSCPQVNRDFKIEDARRACKPDFVPGRRPGDGHSSKRAIARALLAANPDLWAKAACGDIGNPIKPAQGPYSALLPVGLAMRRLLPAPRWALTPPFHPYRRLCGARPCTTAVCFLWRFPSGYPARALPGTVASGSPDFPRAFAGPRPSSPPRRLGPTPAPALRQSPFEI